MFFRPDQGPRPKFPREFSTDFVGPIMTGDSISEIIRVANVETSGRILKDVHPEHRNWLQR